VEATDGWDDQERAVLEVTDELSRSSILTGETWRRLESFLDTAQMIELILLVGFYRGLAGFIESVGIELDETFGGGAEERWPAERAASGES
jgi:4-carboxymuconolactone decarboxylase